MSTHLNFGHYKAEFLLALLPSHTFYVLICLAFLQAYRHHSLVFLYKPWFYIAGGMGFEPPISTVPVCYTSISNKVNIK
jgi:hypothetical protein